MLAAADELMEANEEVPVADKEALVANDNMIVELGHMLVANECVPATTLTTRASAILSACHSCDATFVPHLALAALTGMKMGQNGVIATRART